MVFGGGASFSSRKLALPPTANRQADRAEIYTTWLGLFSLGFQEQSRQPLISSSH
jgi:hypothetical protein